jgi:hypothetical protein
MIAIMARPNPGDFELSPGKAAGKQPANGRKD